MKQIIILFGALLWFCFWIGATGFYFDFLSEPQRSQWWAFGIALLLVGPAIGIIGMIGILSLWP